MYSPSVLLIIVLLLYLSRLPLPSYLRTELSNPHNSRCHRVSIAVAVVHSGRVQLAVGIKNSETKFKALSPLFFPPTNNVRSQCFKRRFRSGNDRDIHVHGPTLVAPWIEKWRTGGGQDRTGSEFMRQTLRWIKFLIDGFTVVESVLSLTYLWQISTCYLVSFTPSLL